MLEEMGDLEQLCANCRTRLTPGMQWCAQCYTPIARPEDEAPEDPDEDAPAEPLPEPVYTVWQPTPTSFGPIPRIVITAMFLAIGVGLYPALMAWTDMTGTVGLAFSFVYVALFVAAGAMFLTQVWRRHRVR